MKTVKGGKTSSEVQLVNNKNLKKLLSILFLFSFLIAISQPNVKIGMSLEEFKKLYPTAKETKFEKEINFEVDDTIHGLISGWGYNFVEGKLKWMSFSKYIGELSESNFSKCLKATKAIIADYTNWYYEPDETIEGKQKFVDPYKTKHWGYDVLEARWKNVNGQKMKVEFTFMGGKGEYHLIVTINHFDKDYPYYE